MASDGLVDQSRAELREVEARPLNLTERHQFYLQLKTMFSAGCPIADCFRVLASGGNSKALTDTASAILVSIESGLSLSQAMRKEEPRFSKMEVGFINIAERTGGLSAVLARLALSFEKRVKFRQQFVSAIVQPSVTLIFSVTMALLIAFVFLPRMIRFFESFNAPLPWSTQFILWSGEIWPWLAFLGIVVLTLISLALRTETGRAVMLEFFPPLGRLVRQRELGEAATTLALLLHSGHPIAKGFVLTSNQVWSFPLRQSLLAIGDGLNEGVSLAQLLKQDECLPKLWKNLVLTGDETGRLDEVFWRLSDFYLDEFQWRLERSLSLVEPIFLAALGLFVGFLLFSCFVPFYQLLFVGL